jgi:transcriptional regulator with XRE-family HTH domain
MQKISDIIKSIRSSQGVSQDFISETLGLSRDGYSRKERGLNAFTFDEVQRVAEILGTTVPQMMGSASPSVDAAQRVAIGFVELIDARVAEYVRINLHSMVNEALDQRAGQQQYSVSVYEPPMAAEPATPNRKPKRR